jgi:hypothetical protein
MNVTRVPREEATAALTGWLSRSDFQVEVQTEDQHEPVWRVIEKSDAERFLVIRSIEHLDALALSYTVPLAGGPRLKKLELVSELNDTMAFARFSLDRAEDLQVEYMISCINSHLPSCLVYMVGKLIDLGQGLDGVLEDWGLQLSAFESRHQCQSARLS